MSYGRRTPYKEVTPAEMAWRGLTPAQQRLLMELAAHGGGYVETRRMTVAGNLRARGLVTLETNGTATLTADGRAVAAVGVK